MAIIERHSVVDNSDPFAPSPQWREMEQERRVCRHLWAGTRTLRKHGKLYLLQKAMESDAIYDRRLAQATLYNVFSRAVGGLVGRVFSKAVSVIDAPDKFEPWFEDIDLQGNNIDMFAKSVFETAMTEGVSFILVDFPPAIKADSIEEEKKLTKEFPRRTYWVHAKPEEVIGWRFNYFHGIPVLSQLRIRQYFYVPDGEYGQKRVEHVRVYEPGFCTIFERDEQGGEPRITGPITMGIPIIPIIPVYTKFLSPFVAAPPLLDLALLNIRHYQSNSCQDHVLDYSRFPFLFGRKLFRPGKEEKEIPLGPSLLVHSHEHDSDLRFVEHQGHAIAHGAASLKELEDRMAALSYEPLLTRRSGAETATRVAIDSAAATSTLQAWAFQLKDALEQALVITAMWEKVSVTQAGSISMNTDYALTLSSADFSSLIQLRKEGELSRSSLWEELSRRGLLGPDFDAELERELLREEGALRDSGDGLLPRMVEKMVLPKELLFHMLKKRGLIEADVEWADVQIMMNRENVGPAVGFGPLNTLERMLQEDVQ